MLRSAALEAVRQWKYRPVIRDGAPVPALVNASVEFSSGAGGSDEDQDAAGLIVVASRRMQLEKELPRSAQEILTDLEQDSEAGDDSRQFYMLDEMTKAALHAGAFVKAAEYAEELLGKASQNADDVNYGNPNRSAGIGPDGSKTQPRRCRYARTARRHTWPAVRPPGVDGDV